MKVQEHNQVSFLSLGLLDVIQMLFEVGLNIPSFVVI